jgi:aspartyl protease family protein
MTFTTINRIGGYFLAAFVLSWTPYASAVDVGLAGIFPGKALLTFDGGVLRTVALGATTEEGVTLVAIGDNTATLKVDGVKRTLRVGQNVRTSASKSSSAKAVLRANPSGHFHTTGKINGVPVRFLVDTGATFIAMGINEARRIGIDPGKGQVRMTATANGVVRTSIVKLDSVELGGIVFHNIDGAVLPGELPFILLGMNFLSRTEMQHRGGILTLKKIY